MSTPAIGIDLGGTSLRIGLVSDHGSIISSHSFGTPGSANGYDWLLDTIHITVEQLSNEAGNPNIPFGFAVPGPIDAASGTVTRCVNLPWLEGRPLVRQLETLTRRRVVLMTDADAATWGEYVAAGSPAAPFAHLRLGTGIACGVVVGCGLVPTKPARRTHWPALVVDESPEAPPCPCGLRGCLELYASGKAFAVKARVLGFQELASLQSAFEQGDPRATQVLEASARAIVAAMDNLVGRLGVRTVAMGGGVHTSLPSLFRLVSTHQRENPVVGVDVRESSLGDEAGVIGAARLAMQ